MQTSKDNIGRIYHTPKGDYYSVTTMLGATKDDGWLKAWHNRVGPEEASKISKIATNTGTRFHGICEDYLNENKVKKTFDPVANSLFRKSKSIIDKHVTKVLHTEVPVYSDMLQLAGTIDAVVEWEGVLALLDFKTCQTLPKEEWIRDYWIQLTCYSKMYYDRYGEIPGQLILLFAPKKTAIASFKIDLAAHHIKDTFDRIVKFRSLLNN